MRALCWLLLAGAAAALRVPPANETARMARFVAHACDWGALATLSAQEPPMRGQPFANIFSISDGEVSNGTGVPYMYLTPLEISVKDLQGHCEDKLKERRTKQCKPLAAPYYGSEMKVNGNASLTLSLAQTPYCKDKGYDPQDPLCAHVIFFGVVEKVTGTEAGFAKTALFSRHPEMNDWPVEHNWFFAKLSISNIWVLSHFGGIETVTPKDYFNATPW